jgi:hypothetical protein
MRYLTRLLAASVICLPTLVLASSYFVSTSGNNTTGTSWTTARNELNQIQWSGIQPGDTIFIDGGSDSMVYSTNLAVGKSGVANQPIVVTRSTQAGHSGKVVITRNFSTDYAYITIDGLDKYKFVFHILGTGYLVRINNNADFFEFKNVSLITKFDTLNAWGTPLYATNAHTLIKGCWFFDTNAEDQIKYNGAGKLTIEDSYFSGLAEHGGIHEDIVQFDVPLVETLIVRRNIFITEGTSSFYLQTTVNYLEAGYNVFSRASWGIMCSGGTTFRVYNNVFDRCWDFSIGGTVTSFYFRNCIFNGTSWTGPVHLTGYPQYSLWDIGTTNWQADTGNFQAAPLFMDEDNLLGADSLPFTADDGFRLQGTSPAINAGTATGCSTDIMGTPISGPPDMGAYEYSFVNCTDLKPRPYYSMDKNSGYEPLPVTFDASPSVSCGDSIVTYAWNFGDGATGSGLTATHTYASGVFTVTLTVINENGFADSTKKTVTILPSPVPNLVLYLNGDNNIQDLSGRSNAVSWSGTASYGMGKFGQAFSLDGSSSGAYVQVNHKDVLDGMPALTFAVWAKKNSAAAAENLIYKHVTYTLAATAGGLGTSCAGNTISYNLGTNDVDWHHYALTYDGAALKLYLDTVMVSTRACTGRVAVNTDRAVIIGKYPWGNSFNGLIDEVRIYDRALPQSELAGLFRGQFSSMTAPAVGPRVSTARLTANPLTGPDGLAALQQAGLGLVSISGTKVLDMTSLKDYPNGVYFAVNARNEIVQKIMVINK